MEKESRKRKRAPAAGICVYFGTKSPDHLGIAQDVSEGGIRIRARKGYPKDTVLVMSVEVPGLGMVPAKGVVCRARKVKPALPPHEPVELGIIILEGSKTLKDMILNLLAGFVEKRGVYRKEIQLSAALGSVQRLILDFTQNIGDGGVFIVTENPENIGEIHPVLIELPPPFGTVHAEGEVVHVVSPEEAALRGRLPGCGIKFRKFAPGDEEKYSAFLLKLRQEDNPV